MINMNPKVSICIPTYEANGEGLKLLRDNFSHIENQTFTDYEIIISDHSKDDIIMNFCKSRCDILPIKYVRFNEKYNNGPANTNNVIKHANGEYIKLLFQDDFFKYDYSLKKMITILESSDEQWIVTSCDHTLLNSINVYRNYHPTWGNLKLPATSKEYMDNVPHLGSPSNVMYKRNPNLLFDETLVMYMDVDFYYSLIRMYGMPILEQEILMTIRIWNGSITNTSGRNVNLNTEIQYISNKYTNE